MSTTRFPSIASLMSPPEPKPLEATEFPSNPVLSQFRFVDNSTSSCQLSKPKQDSEKMRILPSPPISPATHVEHNISKPDITTQYPEKSNTHRDPLLYPNETPVLSRPLFEANQEQDDIDRLIEDHIQKVFAPHSVQPKSKGYRKRRYELPTRDEYKLMIGCVSKINKLYNANPKAYLKRVREENDENYPLAKKIRGEPQMRPVPILKPKEQRLLQPLLAASSITRDFEGPKKPKPKARSLVQQDLSAPKKAPAKKPDNNNYRFMDIPDYSPSISTLPNNPKAFGNVDWNSGSPLDLSTDPDKDLLHEAEFQMAQRLRLSCASYLCVKRRIFVGRVNNYIRGKKFTKTDAQSCGRIDVNKASKLWIAYDKVGWFDRKHFEDAIQTVQSSEQAYDPTQQCYVDTSKFFA
jgi:hypothetical protein